MNNKSILTITLLIVSIPFGFYIYQFNDRPLSYDPGHWAQFGDYIGGLLNPILSAAAFILLLKTIAQNDEALKLNAEELALTRAELQKSAQAQIQQTEIDKINLSDRRNSESQQRYSNYIDSLRDEIIGITELKQMKLAVDYSPISLRDLISQSSNNRSTVIDYSRDAQDREHLSLHFIYVLSKLKSIIEAIQNGGGLDGNPNKDQIIKHKMAKCGQFLKRTVTVLKLIVVQEITSTGDTQETLYLDSDPKCKEAIKNLEDLFVF